MEICYNHGIAHSAFLAWPYDDQDKAIAYVLHRRAQAVERARACSVCGTVPEDWIDAESGRRLAEPRWVVESAECPGCAYIESEMGQLDPVVREQKHRHIRLRPATEADFVDVDGDDG